MSQTMSAVIMYPKETIPGRMEARVVIRTEILQVIFVKSSEHTPVPDSDLFYSRLVLT